MHSGPGSGRTERRLRHAALEARGRRNRRRHPGALHVEGRRGLRDPARSAEVPWISPSISAFPESWPRSRSSANPGRHRLPTRRGRSRRGWRLRSPEGHAPRTQDRAGLRAPALSRRSGARVPPRRTRTRAPDHPAHQPIRALYGSGTFRTALPKARLYDSPPSRITEFGVAAHRWIADARYGAEPMEECGEKRML